MSNAKGAAVALAIAAAVGYGWGQSHAVTHTEYRVLHDTKTVTVTQPADIIPGPPPSDCVDMAATAKKLIRAGGKYDTISAHLIDTISDIRLAAAEGNSAMANSVETRVRKLDAATIGAAMTFSDSKPILNREYKNCTKGLKYSHE